MKNYTQLLRALLIIGIFGSLFVPFIVATDLFFPFITGKAYAFRIITEIVFGLWIMLLIFDPLARPRKSWMLWSFTTFLIITFIANLQGIDALKSFWSNYERMEGYVTLLHLFGYFLVAAATFYKTKLWNIFWNFSIVLSVAHVGYGLLQKVGVLQVGLSADRIDGTFGNPIYMGIFMLFHVFLTLFYLLKHQGAMWVKYWYALAIALQVIAIFWTATRGAILALIGGVLLTFILIAIVEPKKKVLRRITAGVILIIVLFTGMIFGLKDTALVENITGFRRLAETSFTEGTVHARFVNWSIAWEASKEKFLLGYGQGNYGPVFDKYYDPRMWDEELWFDRVHNIVFDWLIAGGILGLLAYLSIFVATLYYLWRKKTPFSGVEKSVLTALLAAYFFHNLFVFDNLISYMLFALVLAFIHAESTKDVAEQLIQEKKSKNGLPKAIGTPIAILALIAIPFGVWGINGQSLHQNKELINGLRLRSVDGIPASIQSFETALGASSFGTTEVRQQLIAFTSRLIPTPQVDNDTKLQLVAMVGEEVQKEFDTRPQSARFLLLTGQFLAQTGNYDSAFELFNQAKALSPKKQFINEPVISVLRQLERSDEALEIARESYLIHTDNDDAWRTYVRMAIEAEADDIYDALINEAYETGKGKRVVRLAQENLRNDPENVQAWASLAVAHYRNGNTEKAVEELRKLANQFPEAKAQADDLIQRIEAGEEIL